MKLSVVIPIFNESGTVQDIIEKVRKIPIDKEIVVVDDGSSDGTREKLKQLESRNDASFRVFYHEKNMGKGAALRTGFRHAKGDVVITQDADLEYDPSEYQLLLEPILKGVADVVYGSRLSGGKPRRVYLFWHKVGNGFLTFFTNFLYNTTLTDMETGYKVFRREVIQSITIRSNDFRVEPELTAKVFKARKWRVYEIPISYYGRTHAEGKKIHWTDGFRALWALLKYRFVD